MLDMMNTWVNSQVSRGKGVRRFARKSGNGEFVGPTTNWACGLWTNTYGNGGLYDNKEWCLRWFLRWLLTGNVSGNDQWLTGAS